MVLLSKNFFFLEKDIQMQSGTVKVKYLAKSFNRSKILAVTVLTLLQNPESFLERKMLPQ